jgi:threonine dehydratase
MNTDEIKDTLSVKNLTSAYDIASRHFFETPIVKADFISERTGANVFLKLEGQQKTNAFKFRGAVNALLSLNFDNKDKVVVCSSSGSHALGMCKAGRDLGIKIIVFLPKITPEYKVKKIKMLGGEINFFGEFLSEAQLEAESFAKERSLFYISPYNHPSTIQGNGGFIAHEIMNSKIHFSEIICPVGGGGLVSGLAAALSLAGYNTDVTGVESEANPSMKNAIVNDNMNYPLNPKESIAEALNCSVSYAGFPLIKEFVKELCLVPEQEIKNTMKILLEKEGLLTEGAGAIAVAHLLNIKKVEKNHNYLLLITGANIKKSTVKNL